MRRRLMGLLLAGAAFVLSPGFGCGDDFDYGPEEMRAAGEGVWEVRLAGQSDPLVRFELRYSSSQAHANGPRFVQPAAACTDRVFVPAASACVDTSRMSFNAQVQESREPYTDTISSAELVVSGRRFTWANLQIAFDGGASLLLLRSPMGDEVGGHLSIPGPAGATSTEVTAVRLSSLP